MKKAFIEWLEKDAPQINNYQWKEWSDELTEKVNTNLATFTSNYSAPRTSVAKVKEDIANIVDTPTYTEPKSNSVVVEDIPDTDISADDDAWVDSILNG
jgi:hypothetical protein